MSCTRRSFHTRQEAMRFLHNQAYPNRITGQMPIRAYKCPKCHWWHVTSKPLKKGQ